MAVRFRRRSGARLSATASAAPKARYVVRPSTPLAGQMTTFNASRTLCQLRPCSYRWRRLLGSAKGRRSRPLGRGKILRYVFRRSGVRYVRLSVRNRRGQRSSMTKRIVVSTAPTSSPTPTTGPSPDPQVELAQPDGGANYYGRFTNPLSTSPAYFPIGVWGAYNQTAANRNLDADVGLNLYVWSADPAFWDDVAADSRFDLFGDPGDRGHPNAGLVNGWVLHDEIDMRRGRVPVLARSTPSRTACPPTAAPDTPTTARASSPAGRQTSSSPASWKPRTCSRTTSTGLPTRTPARASARARRCSGSAGR